MSNKPQEKFILGTAQLGLNYGINNTRGRLQISEAVDLLQHAAENGVRFLDSSEAYGDAHVKIGAASKLGIHFDVFTKFVASKERGIRSQVDQILNEIESESIAGLSFHRFGDYVHFSDWDTLEQMKKEGAFSLIGVSIYSNDEIGACLLDPRIDLVQIPFNLLDSNNQKLALIRSLVESGKIVHTRSTFLQGLFQKQPEEFPEFLKPLKGVVSTIRDIASENQMTAGELALRYSFSFPDIHGVIIGLESESQLWQNLELLQKGSITDRLMKKIRRIVVSDSALLNPSTWR